ncbi:hypothetical protein NX84_04115 [Corynebacterium minutissimum]|nr:hypothetical protein NX84_04115 [Corynebacterium minutissimum]
MKGYMGIPRQLPRAYQCTIMFAGVVLVLRKSEKVCKVVVQLGRRRGEAAEGVDRLYVGNVRMVSASEV